MRFPGRKTIRTFAILAIVLIVLSPLLKIYLNVGSFWLCSLLKWEFSTPLDRERSSSPKDVAVAFIFTCKPPLTDRNLGIVLGELTDLVSNHTDSDSVHLKMTFAKKNLHADPTGLSPLSEWCKDNSSELELLLSCESRREPSFRAQLYGHLAVLKSHGWATMIDSETRFTVVRERCRSELAGTIPAEQIRVLAQAGCYADMSFPDIESRHKRTGINSIYSVSSAVSDPFRDCSYLRTGELDTGDLVVIDGPLLTDWADWRDSYGPLVENGCLTPSNLPDSRRVESWIRANVHVIGQPDWIFVKLRITNLVDAPSARRVLQALHQSLSYLENVYRDNEAYRLHYVTAREMYNIARAAEAGRTGDAAAFRDYMIQPYEATIPSE